MGDAPAVPLRWILAGERSLGGVPPLNWLSKAWKRVSLPKGRVQRVYPAVYWETSYSSHENVGPDADSGAVGPDVERGSWEKSRVQSVK